MLEPAAPLLVLVHSPLAGALTWQPVADRLRAQGHAVLVPALAGGLDACPPYAPRLAALGAAAVRAVRHPGPLILVGHSGAGALLPATCPPARSSRRRERW